MSNFSLFYFLQHSYVFLKVKLLKILNVLLHKQQDYVDLFKNRNKAKWQKAKSIKSIWKIAELQKNALSNSNILPVTRSKVNRLLVFPSTILNIRIEDSSRSSALTNSCGSNFDSPSLILKIRQTFRNKTSGRKWRSNFSGG